MLGRQHDGVDTGDDAVLVAAGDLRLGVRAQPAEAAVLARFSLTLDQTVSEGNRGRHQHVGFVAGVAEHQALVTGALIFRLLAVNALGDVRRLLADDVDHAAGGAVVADVRGGVADVADDAAHQVFEVDPGAGGDFTADDGNTGLDHGFTGDPGKFVFAQDGVQNGVGNLVSQFVRMAFGHGFGGENRVIAHGSFLSSGEGDSGLASCSSCS